MTFTLDTTQLISILVTLVGCFWTLGKILFSVIDKKINSTAVLATEAVTKAAAIEMQLMAFKLDVSETRLHKDDYVRGQTVIEAKLDALFDRLTETQLQQVKTNIVRS